MFPESIKKFIDIFSKLPSIGPRQATRLAFYMISGGKNKLEETAKAVADLKAVKICSNCFFMHSNHGNLCNICQDKNRKNDAIMIVEKETDLVSIERTKKFHGRYLVLGELAKTGVLEISQKLRLNNLKNLIKKELGGVADEIIIATNPTTYGDLNAMIIKKELEGFAKKFTRLGRGIPTGGEIEFADEETLEQALKRRD
ncbi:recombination protein RecR [Candidatus Wolfebacteria bacterium]|nr:recombination protein RecR [Candidatus Wolfebacteria bacterium]